MNDFNVQAHNREPITVIDEVSSTEYYVGVSINYRDYSKACWRIKKIWKVGSVWHIGFPEYNDPKVKTGNQDFVWVWDNRLSYIYSA